MKRITRKRVSVILLIMALIVTQIPPFEAKAVMSDFVVEGTTLIKYEGSESTVTIPNYIETIGREAFLVYDHPRDQCMGSHVISA